MCICWTLTASSKYTSNNLVDWDFILGFAPLGTLLSSCAEGCLAWMTLLVVSTTTDVACSFLEAYSAPCMAIHGVHEGSVYRGGNGTICGETSLVSEMDVEQIWWMLEFLHHSVCPHYLSFVFPAFHLVPEPSIHDHYTCLHKFQLKRLQIHRT
jgi:hypothetical protein